MNRKCTPDDYEEAFNWCISRTNKEISFYKNRAISIYKLFRTEYKKLAHFKNGVSVFGWILEWGIKNWPIIFEHGVVILGEIFLERGANLESQAAHTHPKNTQVPPLVSPCSSPLRDISGDELQATSYTDHFNILPGFCPTVIVCVWQ